MKIQLSDYGTTLGPRVLGIKIKDQILDKFESENEIIFDLTGIQSLSTGFSKELFGELFVKLGQDFNKRVKFKLDGGSNNERLLKIINRGISNSVESRNR